MNIYLLNLCNISIILSSTVASIIFTILKKDHKILLVATILTIELLIVSYNINFGLELICIIKHIILISIILIKSKKKQLISYILITILFYKNIEIYNMFNTILIIKVFLMDRIAVKHSNFNSNNKLEFYHKKLKDFSIKNKAIDTKILSSVEVINNLNEEIKEIILNPSVPILITDNNLNIIYKNKNQDVKNICNSQLNLESILLSDKLNTVESIKEYLNIKENIKSINISLDGDKIYRTTIINYIIDDTLLKICIFHDITESYLMNKTLIENDKIQENIMELIDDGVLICNDNQIHYMNNKLRNILGINEDIKYLNLLDKFIMKDKKITDILNDNKCNTHTIKLKNNKIIQISKEIMIVKDEKICIFIVSDITEIYNIKNEIEESEYIYKTLLKIIPESIAVIDKETLYPIYRNEKMISLMKNIGIENLNEIIKSYLNEEKYEVFKKYKINNKKELYVAIVNHHINENYVLVIRESESKVNIENLVNELSQVKEKDRLKTEFLSSVSNDLKTPIKNIESTMDVFRESLYSSNHIKTYVDLVSQNLNRLIKILNNIDDIESINSSKFKVNKSEVNIVEYIKTLTDLCEEYTSKKNINLSTEINIKNRYINIDKNSFTKVMLNLLSNAIKFTPNGGCIDILIVEEDEELVLKIRDNGKGIPRDKLNLIFEKYEQVDRTLSRGAEGTGIGLSLVKKICAINGWSIKVISEVKKGSEFTVNIKEATYLLNDDTCNYDKYEIKKEIEREFSDIYYEESV